MGRARTYSSFCSQVILVYLYPFHCKSLFCSRKSPKKSPKEVALFLLFARGNPLAQRHKILSQNTRDSKLSYGENIKSLSHLGSDRYRDVTDKTDRHQNRYTIANIRAISIAMLALARKNKSPGSAYGAIWRTVASCCWGEGRPCSMFRPGPRWGFNPETIHL